MSDLFEKLEQISELIKAKLSPNLRMPGLAAPKPPKAPSLAPPSRKNPVKVAQQVQDPSIKQHAMGQATAQVKANRNPFAFSVLKSEGNSHHFHIVKDGTRITNEPMTIEDINRKHGGVQELESSGHSLVPVQWHELHQDRHTGQWSLKPKR